MKQYDKIWVPNDLDQLATKYMLIGADSHYPIGGLDQKENVIVLIMEELRECFKWGMSSFGDAQTPDQSFNDFLESKGIQIKQ